MTAAISRASVWSEFGQLIVDGTLPDPESIRFQPGMVAVALDNAGDLFAWAEHVGARVDGSGVNFSDSTGHWLTSAHAWGWHGWTVQLWTVNGNELHRPEDLPGAGEEVAGPGARSATAPTETSRAGDTDTSPEVPAVATTRPGTQTLLGAGEVAGVAVGSGPATAAQPEHYHSGGAAGGPGENEAECACGAVFAGFDTHAEATAALDRHIADGVS